MQFLFCLIILDCVLQELKKSATWKTQVDVYKKQVAELHQKLNEETKMVDKLEFENKKIQEQSKALKREKEVCELDQS